MERRIIRIQGIVQGVGFRPFVYNLAVRLGLAGFVQNQTGSVRIEVEGETAALDRFVAEVSERPPPLAYIERFSWQPLPPRGEQQFHIVSSESDPASPVFLSPDVAVCRACLAELFDPGDRRFGYPFLNCTDCGPRLTIITGAPYDRPRTTMAGFAMCPACRAEYDDPRDRRFHAQPTACPVCGPRLQLLDAAGQALAAADPLAVFADALVRGQIGALKGLGGYHLACDARHPSAVAELRRRKHRDEKPFAVMVADVAAAQALAEVGSVERSLLESGACPIVLLRKRLAPSVALAEAVAPGNRWLGAMLPYTPLHHLLLRAVGGIPLVMTSGNRSDEPIVHRDDEWQRLAGIADLFLIHNRPIHIRCDDSVTRVVEGVELPLRRSRGYAPRPLPLPLTCPRPLLAVGGQLKGTFALGRGGQAILSHHLGDLDYHEAYLAFERDADLYQQLFAVKPEVLVHDMHPDYAATHYAQKRAEKDGLPLLAVQHHHAHMASCMAENGLTEAVIGVSFDGTGYGTDGAIWGGEFLVGDLRQFRRAAHLRYVALPGGERAIREPWRMAAAHLLDAGLDLTPLATRLLPAELKTIQQMVERRLNSPFTSSMGRLFDAVAALAGVRDRVRYEGQAAVELEWLAEDVPPDRTYPLAFDPPRQGPPAEAPWIVDTRPLFRAAAEEVNQGEPAARIARRFHSSVVELVRVVCNRLRQSDGIDAVILSGGVFLNALLTREVGARLRGDGFRVYRHRLVPPNDGGLSLGQIAVAAARLA
jgi:hydrogenase maturation protein HypF